MAVVHSDCYVLISKSGIMEQPIKLYNLTDNTSYKLNINNMSKRFRWNKEDTINFAKDTFKVLAPYIIVIIPVLILEVPSDWAYASILLFVLHRIRAAAELLVAGKK